MNRAVFGVKLFERGADYFAFERLLVESLHREALRIPCYCLMPNHFHFMMWPVGDEDVSRLMHLLCTTHARRWRDYRDTKGRGHVYQGPFKVVPVEDGQNFLRVCRYVERNALRAGLVKRAEDWRWGSLWWLGRVSSVSAPTLSQGPLPFPKDWVRIVNDPQTESELEAIRTSIRRGRPIGSREWAIETAKRLKEKATGSLP